MTGAKMQADFGIEALEKREEFALTESLKLASHQIGYFWLGNAEKLTNFTLFQAALFQQT